MEREKVTLDYSVGEHISEPDTIIISVTGTGIRTTNEGHKRFMDILTKVMATQMYAHAQGAEIENVKF